MSSIDRTDDNPDKIIRASADATAQPCRPAGADQRNPDGCPPWCGGEHLYTAASEGWHHDMYGLNLLPAAQPHAAGQDYLMAGVEQFQPYDGPAYPAAVRISTELRDQSLSPAEARQFAVELLRLAALADGSSRQVSLSERTARVRSLTTAAQKGALDPAGLRLADREVRTALEDVEAAGDEPGRLRRAVADWSNAGADR